MPLFQALVLLVLAGLAGPLLAATRRPLVPVLVGELAAGALLGRTGLDWLHPGVQPFQSIMAIGFVMLMLQAGSEVDIGSPDLRAGAPKGALAFLVTLAVSVPIGFAIAGALGAGQGTLLLVLVAGSSAAVAFPVISEQGLSGPSIAVVLAWITIADAVTALLMPLSLTGPSAIPGALLGDALIVVVAVIVVVVAHRLFATTISDAAKRMSKARHWALQLRSALLLLLVLAAIAQATGASLLVAGFAAGIVLRQFHEPHRFEHQLTGLATGFFVPAFFVLLGANLDLAGLVRSPAAIAVAVAMAVGATAAHLAGSLVTPAGRRAASGLLTSAQLGLPAAAATLALSTHALPPPMAAALVAGGILTLVAATAGAALLARMAGAPQAVG